MKTIILNHICFPEKIRLCSLQAVLSPFGLLTGHMRSITIVMPRLTSVSVLNILVLNPNGANLQLKQAKFLDTQAIQCLYLLLSLSLPALVLVPAHVKTSLGLPIQ